MDILGSGTNRLTIAQYGIHHFELVLEDGIDQLSLNPPVPFIPLVNVKGNLTELDSLTPETQGLFEELHVMHETQMANTMKKLRIIFKTTVLITEITPTSFSCERTRLIKLNIHFLKYRM